MRKCLALCAVLVLLSVIAGCSFPHNEFEETVQFYYRRAEYSYHSQEPVIAAERREVTGHRSDMDYLVTLYLMGPIDKELALPFPAGTRLEQIQKEEKSLTVKLSDTGRALTDVRFSLACACLSETCIGMGDFDSITIISGARSLTTSSEDLLLTDD